MMSTRPLAELFITLERAGIRWALLRAPSRPDQDGGDVDLLVDRADLRRLRCILHRCGFVQLPGWSPGLHFLAFDPETAQWTWLDVRSEVAFGPYSLLRTSAEGGCLNRRVSNGAPPVLAPDDDFWVLLLHCLLDKRQVAAHHRARLQELAAAARPDGPLALTVAANAPVDWPPEVILRHVEDGAWAKLEAFAPLLLASWMRRQGLGAPAVLARRLSLLFGRLRKGRLRRGLSVALVGPDGAGKSTLVAGLQDAFPLPVRPLYMGLTGGVLPHVDRLRLPFLVVPGRICVFWSRYLRAVYHQARGRLVVFDRYIYDSMVPTPFLLTRLQRVYRWIDGHSCPAPDLLLVLDAPGAVMHARKGEYTPEMLEDWRSHFLALTRVVANAEILDARRTREVVLKDAIGRIWQRYAARWGAAHAETAMVLPAPVLKAEPPS